MSAVRNPTRSALRQRATFFSALGDETRLTLVSRLADGSSQSISRLAENSTLTRQAVTKHLHVLQTAGVVRGARVGRETMFALAPDAIVDARQYLDRVSQHWDNALSRLKTLVER